MNDAHGVKLFINRSTYKHLRFRGFNELKREPEKRIYKFV
jgi:hypothetical protein